MRCTNATCEPGFCDALQDFCVCPHPYSGTSVWADDHDCHVNTILAACLISLAGVAGLASLAAGLYAFVREGQHGMGRAAASRFATRCFLWHSNVESACQIALCACWLSGITVHDHPPLLILQVVLAWAVLGGTPHTCVMWLIGLPTNLLPEQERLTSLAKMVTDTAATFDAILLVLFVASLAPALVLMDDDGIRLSIQLAYPVAGALATILPVVVVPTYSATVYSVACGRDVRSTSRRTSPPAAAAPTPRSWTLRASRRLQSFRAPSGEWGSRDIGVSLVALYREGRQHACITHDPDPQQRAKLSNMVLQLQLSAGVTIFLGGGALLLYYVIAFVPWAYARPHIFWVWLALIASAWQVFIMAMFCRLSSFVEIVRRASSAADPSASPRGTTRMYRGFPQRGSSDLSSAMASCADLTSVASIPTPTP